MALMDDDITAGLEAAITGTKAMTDALLRLREQREHYLRAYGFRQTRETFAELDQALRALRKAAKT